jgi:hypothetical protein
VIGIDTSGQANEVNAAQLPLTLLSLLYAMPRKAIAFSASKRRLTAHNQFAAGR